MRGRVTAGRRVGAFVLLTVAIGVAATVRLTSDSRVGTNQGSLADPFSKPPTPSDRLPVWLKRLGPHEVLATRRIAFYMRNGRTAGLYLARARGQGLCMVLVAGQAAGGGCSSGPPTVTQAIRLQYGLGYASGIVRNDVRSLIVIGTQGRRHRVPVSPTGGFIYRCRAYMGCSASVRSIETYNGDGRLVGSDSLPGP